MLENFLNQIHGIFNNIKVRKVLLKLRIPIGILLFALIITRLRQEWFFPGIVVSVLGEMLQVWCFSTIKTKKQLTVYGPYMFVRNPMYIGRFFLIFGVLMMTGNPQIMIGFTILYYFYMVNRVKREERVLAELFGKDYDVYCRDVHPYLPTLKRFDKNALWSFNIESFRQNHALGNLLLVAASYIILYLLTFIWPVSRSL
jgi:isoprenylcysteine carboxyl methyltransferase (ICMT) family protein YpbQ